MPQFGTSLTDDSKVLIYDHNMFLIQATGVRVMTIFQFSIAFDKTGLVRLLLQPIYKGYPELCSEHVSCNDSSRPEEIL